MGRTPDRRPGPLEEDEEIRFTANPTSPTVSGAFNFDGNSFIFYDSVGNFNLRGGGVFDVVGSVATFLYTASFPAGLSGSLTQLVDGNPYIVGGTGINVLTQSNGSIRVDVKDVYASSDNRYLVLSSSTNLLNERIFQVGTGLTSSDGGSGNNYTVGINDSVVATVSGTTFTGVVNFNSGLSGSLTRLVDGTQYIAAGPNIIVTTSSAGQVRISASISGDGSPGNVLTADGVGGATAQGNLIFDGNTLFVYGDAYVQSDLNVDGVMTSINTTNLDIKDGVVGIGFASGSVKQTAGDRGWIGGLLSLDNVLFKWDNAASEFALARTTASSTASLPIPISSYANLHTANIQADIITASLGFSGSLTRLADGSSYLLPGSNISIVSGSNGSITIAAPNLALASAPYVTIGNDSNLTSERALTPGTGITLTDGGANSTVTLGINDSVVATVSGTTFTGVVKFNSGLSGSLTQLTDGTSYIRSGDYISVTSASNGAVTISGTGIAPVGSAYVTIGNDSTLTGERSLTPGTGLTLTDAGANSTVTLAINNSVVATVSGTTFTGVTNHNAGLSGSLTHLTDGTSYLIAGSGIQITSASNGAVTVTNTGQYPPGGSVTQVQFHDTGGVFGGSSLFTFDKTIGAVTASTFVGNVVATTVDASSVVSGSKVYAGDSLESNGYIRLNPGIEYSTIPIGTSESSFLYLTGTNGAVHFAHYDDNENAVSIVNTHLYDGNLQTSLNWGGFLSTQVGTTTFSISSGSGYIVRYNTSPGAEPHPFIKEVRWGNIVSQSLTYVTSSAISYIAIDENANVLQQTTAFSFEGSNEVIVLGRVNHVVGFTNGTVMFPETSYRQVSSFIDFARAFGPLKVSGHVLSPSGSSLRIKKSAGESFIVGGNYAFNAESPNFVNSTEDPDKDAPVFIYSWMSGTTNQILSNAGLGYTVLDPNNYVVDGIKTPVPSGSFTNLRVFYQPLNAQGYLTVYYGQAYYNTLTEAVGSLQSEDFTESPAGALASIFCGYVTVQSGSTDLSNTSQAKITQGALYRNVAGGGGTAGGGGGTAVPGGLDTYVQFNQGGTTFAGDAQFTYNSTTNVLTVGNAMIGGTGELMGSSVTFDLLDTTVQTINFGGAATTIDMGSTAGTNNLFGATKMPQGLSGSLTHLTDGTSYLISSGNITITSASNGAVTVGTTAISPAEHKTLRQLIHLAEEGGPFEGFTLGSYREVLPAGDPFPTSVIWWEDSSKIKKIVEETITYNSQKLVTTDQWKVYDTDGTTILATSTDTISYTGVFETNRTRTIT